ncbi:unnamed protein product [Discosporangium mesarthrocarpum]
MNGASTSATKQLAAATTLLALSVLALSAVLLSGKLSSDGQGKDRQLKMPRVENGNQRTPPGYEDCQEDCRRVGQEHQAMDGKQRHEESDVMESIELPTSPRSLPPLRRNPSAASSETVVPKEKASLLSNEPHPAMGRIHPAQVGNPSSVLNDPPGVQRLPLDDGRQVEMLIHNISHKDMVLALSKTLPGGPKREDWYTNEHTGTVQDYIALARPKFSLYKPASELVHNKLLAMQAEGRFPRNADFPVYKRGEEYKTGAPGSANVAEGRRMLSVGFDFSEDPILVSDLSGFQIRSSDLGKLGLVTPFEGVIGRRDSAGGLLKGGPEVGFLRGRMGQNTYIMGVFFPLLSVLIPKWKEQLLDSSDGNCKKTIVLVSGVGQPRDQDKDPSLEESNSTEATSMLMETFLSQHHSDINVIRLHSSTNIFRYDENMRFVQGELLPLVNAQRCKMAEAHGGDWQDMMHITMSFADGSPARISSINAALRPYRPSYIHIWELKTFWKEARICEDDVEVHTFEDIDMLPPVPPSEVDDNCAMVITEMKRLQEDFEQIQHAGLGNDLASFWLRKTKKPVLAVLLVQKLGEEPKVYRGTNMEVSMPTGSLCAERNVIGSALAADLTLLRRDIKIVAVLGMTLDRSGKDGVGPGAGSGAGGPGAPSLASSHAPTPLQTPLVSPSITPRKPLPQASFNMRNNMPDKQRLEGVRQALFAIATAGEKNVAWGTRAVPKPHGDYSSMNGSGDVGMPLEGGVSEFNNHNNNNDSSINIRYDDSKAGGTGHDEGPKEGQDEAKDNPSPLRGQSDSDQRCRLGAGEGKRERAHSRWKNHRYRSESCADELLHVAEGGATGEGPASATGDQLARSRSFDLGVGVGFMPEGGDLPVKRVHLRRTKLVRSLTIRNGVNRGRGSVVSRVQVQPSSMNPLKPCGACMEWLKKIAEVNPDFKVLTFTDSNCSGVYVEDVSHI